MQLAPALRPPSPTPAPPPNFFFLLLLLLVERPPWGGPRLEGGGGRAGKGRARARKRARAPVSSSRFPPAGSPRLRNPAGTRTQRSRRQPGSVAAATPPGTRSGFPLLPPFQPPNAVAARPGRRAADEKRPSLSPAPEPPTRARGAATAQLSRRARKMPGAEARPRRERPPPPRACGPALPAPPPRPPGSRAKQRAGGRRPRGGGAALTGPAAPSGGRRELRLPTGRRSAGSSNWGLASCPSHPRFSAPFPVSRSARLQSSPVSLPGVRGSLPSPGPGARPPPPRLPGAARPLSSPLRRLPSRL